MEYESMLTSTAFFVEFARINLSNNQLILIKPIASSHFGYTIGGT